MQSNLILGRSPSTSNGAKGGENTMDDNSNVFSDMAAALNDHQVTDDQGQVADDTAFEDTASQEINTENETDSAEKPADSEFEGPRANNADDEIVDDEHAVDESGKRYVPESRFKEVYGKQKATERELKALQDQLAKGDALMRTYSDPKTSSTKQAVPDAQPGKADILELKMTLPQFDPKMDENGVPTNPDYSPELDNLGYDLWKANPGITPVEAGRRALKIARSLAKKQSEVVAEARMVKSLQSDQGITSRVGQRSASQPDVDSMTDKELEAHLKSIGQW